MMRQKVYEPIMVDHQPFSVRLPIGGAYVGDKNEWDQVLDHVGAYDGLFHFMGMFSWCQDIPQNTPSNRVLRGFASARHWDYYASSSQNMRVGFRPVLVPLTPDDFQIDESALNNLEDGTVLQFGTLYMNGVALPNPRFPFWEGDMPEYVHGASLRFGDTDPDTDRQIQWIKYGGILIADRNLINYVSWEDLARQGLAFGREATAFQNSEEMISSDSV